MALTIDGLITGIDTKSIIDGLLKIQQSRITTITAQKTKVNTENQAFISYEAQLAALQASLLSISNTSTGVFQQRTATSSNQDAVTVSANSRALVGTYRLKVEQLATNHQMASQTFSDPTQAITTGTFTLAIGDTSKVITINSANATMQGLANAINDADYGVSASIVATGTTASPSYRLLLSSNQSGVAGKITVTNSLASSSGTAVRPAFADPFIADAQAKSTNQGNAVLSSNSGYQTYTGGVDDTYTFTVATGGTVGTTNGITLNYTNSNGSSTGTITLNSGDANSLKAVASGLQVKLGTGTLVTGDTFSVKVYAKQPDIQQARDAVIAFGEGENAVRISSSTNTVSNALPNVTLNLLQANPTQDIQVDIGLDKEAIKKSINDFVTTLNNFTDFVDSTTKFIPETNQSSPLTGNRAVSSIASRIRSQLIRSVPGINDKLNQLRDAGIVVDSQQRLSLRSDRLDNILNGKVEKVTVSDLQRLFALDGASESPAISFLSASSRTLSRGYGSDGEAVKVQVKVTTAAAQAVYLGTSLPGPVTISDANNSLIIRIGSTEKTVSLTNGTYSPTDLAPQVESKITAAFGAQVARVSINSGKLQIQTVDYGSAAQVKVTQNAAATSLGLTTAASQVGTDVIGKFLVLSANNTVLKTEDAKGSGQTLIGQTQAEEDAKTNVGKVRNITADLRVRVTLGAADIVPGGTTGDITLTQGLAYRLRRTITDVLSGTVDSVKKGYQEKLDSIDKSLKRVNDVFDARKADLQKRFAALERSVSGFNSISQQLTGQLSSLSFGK